MKRFNVFAAVGLLGAVTAQAQTVAELGFEDGDPIFTTEYALTPGIGNVHGDWVNVKEGDVWTEKSEVAHSGEYAFCADNSLPSGQTWDRGFKIGLPELKLETAYRVSFWMRADANYEDENGEVQETKVTSWLSKGMENFDIAMSDESGKAYGLDQVGGLTSSWQRFSFVTFNPSRELIKSLVDGRSWIGGDPFPEQFGGAGESYKAHFDGEIPEMYFFVANMNHAAKYYLDDIKIDETSVKGVFFNNDVLKIDFGWANNVAALAKANNGTVVLAPSTVTVNANGDEVEVLSVEGKEDGFLYVFVDASFWEEDKVTVSFAGDPSILYTAAARPTSETGDVAVFGFSDEEAFFDEDVYAESLDSEGPIMVASNPDSQAWGIDGANLNEITVTYNKALNVTGTSITLRGGGKNVSLTANKTLSEDGATIIISLPNSLIDGEYMLTISGLKASNGAKALEDTRLEFTVGAAAEGGDEAVVYFAADWTDIPASGLPLGWGGTSDSADREGRDAAATYGGAPRMMGVTGNANQGIYWGARGGTEGKLSFGKYAAISAFGDALADGVTADEALWLDEGTYILNYQNACWDTASGNAYSVNICMADETSIYSQEGLVPEITIPQGPGEGFIPVSQYEFDVETPGYYYIEFTGNTGWSCWLLTSLSITAKPASYAGAYIKQLNDAIALAQQQVSSDAKYDGTTKDALAAALAKATEGEFNSPAKVTAIVDELNAAIAAFADRKANYDTFVNNFSAAQSKYETMDAKYKNSNIAKTVEALIAQYGEVDPSSLSDAELASVAQAVKAVSGQIDNVASIVNTYTYQAIKASELADVFGIAGTEREAVDALAEDDSEVIAALNKLTTLSLYKVIAQQGRDAWMDYIQPEELYYNAPGDMIEEIPAGDEDLYNDNGFKKAITGANFEAFVRNPKFYTTSTGGLTPGSDDLPGWNIEAIDESCGVTFLGDAASDAKPVSDVKVNNYGASNYRIYQVIENLPVGVYDVRLDTRTAVDNLGNAYNAQGEDGTWDKYIFAQVDDQEPVVAPFSVGGGWGQSNVSVVNGLVINEGQKLTIGVVENYLSGLAQKNGEPTEYWDTNTYADDAAVYFVAPLEGFDYAKAAEAIETGVKDITAAPAKKRGVKVSLSAVAVDDSYKGFVIEDGELRYQK